LASPRTWSGSTRRFSGGTVRTGLASIAPSSMANWKIRSASDRQWASVDGPTSRASCACQRRTSVGVILPIGRSVGRSANHGRTCSRSQLSVAARVVGLGSSAAQVSHHSVAQVLNGSRPRWRPCQVPRRISRRFSAARSRASSGVCRRSCRLGSRRRVARRPGSGGRAYARSPTPSRPHSQPAESAAERCPEDQRPLVRHERRRSRSSGRTRPGPWRP
jgi:hypothetical protein